MPSPTSRSAVGLCVFLVLNGLILSDDPSRQGQDRATDVLSLVSQAQDKATANDWKTAAHLWDRVVRLNPVNPAYWASLATARYRAEDFRGAAAAFEKAAALGAPMMGASYAFYEVSRCHARAGEKEKALAALQRALDLGYPALSQPASDPDLASLREDPRLKKMLWKDDTSKMSRADGWRYDLALLAHEARRKGFNPHLSVNREVSWDLFAAKVHELHDAIPTLSDEQIILGLMRLMVLLGDGHTALWTVQGHPLFSSAVRLRLFWFEEGLFVTAAGPEHRSLLGCQILAFDSKPAEDVQEALAPYINRDRGNPIKTKQSSPYLIRVPALLHALGLAKHSDRVILTVKDPTGATRDVEVSADQRDVNIWNTLPAPASWITFASTLANPPQYVRHMDRPQWFEYLPTQKVVYFQFNKVLNDPKEPLDRFADRLFQFIDEHDVEKLVIDLRWNNGGNTWLGQPLLKKVIADKKVNRRGRLYVITGRRTYSAAQNMATYFERFTEATFVGEPTGSSPNFIGEEWPVTLPYSKAVVNISHLFWQSSWPHDQRIWLAPQIYVPPTFADFRAGRDAALEAILNSPTAGRALPTFP